MTCRCCKWFELTETYCHIKENVLPLLGIDYDQYFCGDFDYCEELKKYHGDNNAVDQKKN